MCGKVLIVDDEPDIQGMINLKMRRQIRAGKYNFLFASNGSEAIEILKDQSDIQVLVSDINMPVMDGITLISRIKNDFPDIKSIMVTAYGDMDNIRSAMKNGVHDYLVKPVNFDDFELALERALRIVEKEKEVKIAKQNAREQLELAYEKEKHLNLLKSNFISMVSREYRHPLSVIQSSTDILRTVLNGSADQTTKKFLGHIDLSIKNMSQILDDVLSFEEIDRLEVNKDSVVCISCFIKSIVIEFENLNKMAGRIKYETNKEIIKIPSDEKMLYLIFMNVLSNAAKFSDSGSEIKISLSELIDKVEIEISDSGYGIPEEDHKSIFEPFYRGTNIKKIPGTGMGLSIVKKCIDKLGGEIEIESKQNKGTTVRLVLLKKETVHV
jgi:signal transduction histidine kinase